MKKALREECIDGGKKQFCLLMDKMKIKSGLAFSKLSGKLVGFCNLGSVNFCLLQVKIQEYPRACFTYTCLHGTTSVQAITVICNCNVSKFLHYW